MTFEEQQNLIAYGKSIGVRVGEFFNGEYGVMFNFRATTSAEEAHRDLLALTIQTDRCGINY